MSKPIRILHVIGSMNRGGAEAMIMNYYRNIDRSIVQFDFVENTTEEAAYDREIVNLGGKIYHCPHYNGKKPLTYVRWWKQFFQENKGRYAIVHGHLGSTAAIYLGIAKQFGIYTIAHSHSANERIENLQDVLYKVFSYPTRYIADAFFACSYKAGMARYGRKFTNSGNKSQIVSNAVDIETFCFCQTKRDEMRSRLGIQNSFVVGHVGRFCDAKNHEFLLKVFAVIKQKMPNAKLLLVGGGELEQAIKSQISQLGLQDTVVFAGIQSNVADYCQAMDVFVFPSKYEGLPVSVIEAQASGLSCFLSDTISDEVRVTGLVHFLSLKQSALDWAEYILGNFKDLRKETKQQIVEAGYDIVSAAEKLQSFYCEVADGKGK